MSDALLEVEDLKIGATIYPPGEAPKEIGIVHGVSFTLEKGKVLGLIGESGAGKSTIGLASMAYGRGGCRITGGKVRLNGTDILQLPKSGVRDLRGSRVCYVAQSAAAAFNPAHRLAIRSSRRPCCTVFRTGPKRRRGRIISSRCSVCQTPKSSANAIRTRFRAGSCSGP